MSDWTLWLVADAFLLALAALALAAAFLIELLRGDPRNRSPDRPPG
ncbi:MAG TPA: hypothetical protein VGB99_07165 [Acidobacteriota bacterium]|jgi:hypothetical protein